MSALQDIHHTGPGAFPAWVPAHLRTYLTHVESGVGIRAIARAQGHAPSTILRQIRKAENLRDDPLADAALTRLARSFHRPDTKEPTMNACKKLEDPTLPRETLHVLRALTEPKTILVLAEGVEDGVVVHNAGNDRPVRRAVVARELAESLVLRGLIEGQTTGRLARYHITTAGRHEAARLMAQAESQRATAEAGEGSVVDARAAFGVPQARGTRKRMRPVGADAPLHVLARRKRANGEAYLEPELVAAALRFRESYEIARMGGSLGTDWEGLVSGRIDGGPAIPGGGSTRRLQAQESLSAAIKALGPDLAETVILGVCHENGMEDIESRLDFPARSCKIVLRIALRSLARHYSAEGKGDYDLIY